MECYGSRQWRPGERFYSFSAYLGQKHGGRVRKISVDAGLGCPGKETGSWGGCIYCAEEGFYRGEKNIPVKEQIRQGIDRFRGVKNPPASFIVYFQPGTNTWAPPGKLSKLYDSVRAFPEVSGIAIGTRPDCVDREIIDLIAGYCGNYEVWIEYGMQSSNDDTLRRINRGHGYGEFLKAVELTRRYPDIKICAHLIIGLPGEDEGDFISSASETARLKLEGVKLHPLHVMKTTPLEQEYVSGKIKILTMDEYINAAVKVIEHLHPCTVLQRLSADCADDMLIAPLWLKEGSAVREGIIKELERRNTFQGKLYSE